MDAMDTIITSARGNFPDAGNTLDFYVKSAARQIARLDSSGTFTPERTVQALQGLADAAGGHEDTIHEAYNKELATITQEAEYGADDIPDGLLDRHSLNEIPPLQPLIGKVMDKGTVAMLTAQPAAYKSFMAIDWACCYATGKPWQNNPVDNIITNEEDTSPARGKVLYIAAEGARGLSGRAAAWEAAWDKKVPASHFHVLPKPVQLGNVNSVLRLVDILQSDDYGLVVIDTLARCSLGLEENSATDMGRIIDALYAIRNAMGTDGTVLAVHHLGKSGVVRGSSALLGGVDQLMRLERDGNHITLSDEKRKDGMELEPMDLQVKQSLDSLVIESGGAGWQETNRLVEYMSSGLAELLPMSKSELKSATDLTEREFYACLNRGLRDKTIVPTDDKTPKFNLAGNLRA